MTLVREIGIGYLITRCDICTRYCRLVESDVICLGDLCLAVEFFVWVRYRITAIATRAIYRSLDSDSILTGVAEFCVSYFLTEADIILRDRISIESCLIDLS